jgi:flagellar hook assembly protein FlgD
VSPNPVAAQAAISYHLPRSASVSCIVYDAAGNLVSRLAAGAQAAGEHQLTWNATGVKPGIYFCKLVADGTTYAARLAIVR